MKIFSLLFLCSFAARQLTNQDWAVKKTGNTNYLLSGLIETVKSEIDPSLVVTMTLTLPRVD